MEQLLVLDLETLPDLEAGRALLGEAGAGLDTAALRATPAINAVERARN